MQHPLLKREQVTFWIHRFLKFGITIAEQRQRLIDRFVNAVYIYDDNLVITINCKEDSKTISLDDVKTRCQAIF